jgi:8-oxo-dGTP diphosphatase
MEPEACAGGIVLGDGGTLAMVKSRSSGAWLFPKGRIEAGEDAEAAARREVSEETGLGDLEYIDDLGSFSRPAAGGFAAKSVHMFLFAAPMHANIAAAHEIDEARWIPYREAVERLGSPRQEWFGADRAWFASVFDRVRGAIQRD